MPKCKICGNLIDKNNCFIITNTTKSGKFVKSFYCSEYEYNGYVAKKEEEIELRNRWYSRCCMFFNLPEIINTAFWREVSIWKSICPVDFNLMMCGFLEENHDKFDKAKSRTDGFSEYQAIKYFSAIVCNNFGDYVKKKRSEVKRPVSEEKIDGDIPERINVVIKPKRRSLEDIEDML